MANFVPVLEAEAKNLYQKCIDRGMVEAHIEMRISSDEHGTTVKIAVFFKRDEGGDLELKYINSTVEEGFPVKAASEWIERNL